MKQSDRRRRYGWLVSKSKPSGHLSAGTDDTATAGQDAIIVSLVAEWRACELSLTPPPSLSVSVCVAATETFYQLILRTTCWDWRATACHPDSSRIKGVGVRGRMTFSVWGILTSCRKKRLNPTLPSNSLCSRHSLLYNYTCNKLHLTVEPAKYFCTALICQLLLKQFVVKTEGGTHRAFALCKGCICK